MRFTLETYQQDAVEGLLTGLSKARAGHSEDGELTAVGLTAPTGAGKTVIATGMLEALYHGTPQREAIPELTVLWVTDDRALNAQTIEKILQASGGRIDANRIQFLGDINERTLEPGFIYFIHIQAMQKNSNLHARRRPGETPADHRTHGAWDMIANTIRERGENFLVVWDEAHRGSATSDNARRSIAGTIADGGTTNIGTHQPPAPVVVGISATPDRFHAAMKSANRTVRTVEVPPGEVRESGLLKDRILLRNIAEDQTAENTMLTLAVQDLQAATEAWRRHHEATGDQPVDPLLVVQVEPKVTDQRLGAILTTIEQQWPQLNGTAVAHAFGDPHGPLTVGDRTVRYLPPEAIAGDDRARVVLFKSALTTGWDCPRAEVLVSFQGKDSYTEIAQLMGRLVRTPLARRVDNTLDDRLNEVVAYLPHFRSEHVTRLVTALTEDENVESEVLINAERCERIDAPAVFDLLDTLPSYTRPQAKFTTRTAQMMRLAAALTEHQLVPHASSKAREWIVNQLHAADDNDQEKVDAKVQDLLALTVGTTTIGYGQTVTQQTAATEVATVEADLDGYYTRAQRLMPDGSAAWYYNHLCTARDLDDVDAAARVVALATLGYAQTVEEQARKRIEQWRQDHQKAVSQKPRAVRDQIEPLWHLGEEAMQPTTVVARDIYPAAAAKAVKGQEEPEAIPTYPHHLYVIPAGRKHADLFPVDTSRSSWETEVLERELAQTETLIAWYRNPGSGRHALAVDYQYGNETLLMHPDFLFFHHDGDEIVLDIIDPHRHDLNDASPKWAGLARYAQRHQDRVRNVLAVIRNDTGQFRALDLTVEGVAERLEAAATENQRAALFETEGMAY